MESAYIKFMTCDELREEFDKCPNDINKRILIIDVRSHALFKKSHLCLGPRHKNNGAISKKMRVMNIDPDLVKVCTAKNIATLLSEEDQKIFMRRKDATEVVIIDRNTDSINELTNPKSKIMRLINALTRFDNEVDKKIEVEPHVLKGGYREWFFRYTTFTTNSNFDPEADVGDLSRTSSPLPSAPPELPEPDLVLQPIVLNGSKTDPMRHTPSEILHRVGESTEPSPISHQPPTDRFVPATQIISPRPVIAKPIPIPPSRPMPSTPRAVVKNAPGSAVPIISPQSLRVPLPRSHSSPNVAQAEGDELGDSLNTFDQLNVNQSNPAAVCINNNHLMPHPNSMLAKPLFDRTLKPAMLSLEEQKALNLIRAQIDFGNSPEASGKAITGLQNLGNTCFMNSVIQCLAYTPGLVSYFCPDSYYRDINFDSRYGSRGELAVEFGALIKELNTQRYKYIEPKSFRDATTKHFGFTRNEQQDSHEFMMMLFDKIHHDLNIHARNKSSKQNGLCSQNGTSNNDDSSNINIPRSTLGYQFWEKHVELNKSVVSNLFEGIFMSTLTCTECRGQSNTFEVFNCLSLPIRRNKLIECLTDFSTPETIEEAWECPRCKLKRKARKTIVICKLPRILIIHLKRFSHDERGIRQKLQTTVDVPLTKLSVYCDKVLPQLAYKTSPNSYNLYAVVNHYGNLNSGHYKALCRLENQGWYEFDDKDVSKMDSSDVCGQAAYLLFYGAAV